MVINMKIHEFYSVMSYSLSGRFLLKIRIHFFRLAVGMCLDAFGGDARITVYLFDFVVFVDIPYGQTDNHVRVTVKHITSITKPSGVCRFWVGFSCEAQQVAILIELQLYTNLKIIEFCIFDYKFFIRLEPSKNRSQADGGAA